MNKFQFNKVMSRLFKQRKDINGYYRLVDQYHVYCGKEGCHWDSKGKCTDEEWFIELSRFKSVDLDESKSYAIDYNRLRETINKEVPSVEVYLNNSDNYKVVEIV